jgi:hypothetical protein
MKGEKNVIDCRTAQMAYLETPKRVLFTDVRPQNPSGKRLKRET